MKTCFAGCAQTSRSTPQLSVKVATYEDREKLKELEKAKAEKEKELEGKKSRTKEAEDKAVKLAEKLKVVHNPAK